MTGSGREVDDGPSLRSLVLPVYVPSLCFGIGQGAIIPIMALAAIEIGASIPMAGVIVGMRGLGTLVFDIPAGALVGRLGDRRAMVIATIVVAVSVLGCAWSTSPTMFAGFTFLMGCAWSMWLIARLSYISAAVPVHRRGRVLGLLGGMYRMGNLVGPLLAAVVVAYGGLDNAFYLHLVTAVAGCIVLVATADPGGDERFDHQRVRLGQVFREHSKVFATAGLGTLTIGVLRTARQVAIPLWADHLGFSPAIVGILFAIASTMDVLLFYPAGMVSDRLGRKIVAVPCITLLAIGLLLLPLARSLPALVGVVLILGTGNGIGSGIVMTLGADFAPAAGRAAFLGAFRLLGDVGITTGPMILAVLAGVFSIGTASFVVGLAGLAGGAAVHRFMPETLQRVARRRPPKGSDPVPG